MNDIDKLKEAIAHCKDVEQMFENTLCSQEHAQLRKWLEELLEIKEEYNQ